MKILKTLSPRLLRNPKVLMLMMCALGVGVSLLPITTNAASCSCFCGSNSEGAIMQTAAESSSADCAQTCGDSGKIFVGCFENETQYPRYKDICWSEAECSGWTNVDNPPGTAVFGGQNAYCEHQGGGDSGAAMGYCYAPSKTIPLNVPILGLTEVGDLATYVNAVYKFALPAGALAAVFFVILGGFQYMTAGGSKKGVTQGKERISNALIGLVLIFGAFVIARLVDPRLVVLGQIRTPLIKQSIALSQDTTCETLRDVYGYGVSSSGGTSCGNQGEITSIDNLKKNVSGVTFKVGGKCYFSGGCKSNEACLIMQTGEKIGGVCTACTDAYFGPLSDVSPSDYSCSMIASKLDEKDANEDHDYHCLYTTEGSDACTQVSNASSIPYVDCSRLLSSATSTKDYCTLYEGLQINSVDYITSADFASSMYESEFKAFCSEDPCGFAAKSGKNRCYFEPGVLSMSCTAK